MKPLTRLLFVLIIASLLLSACAISARNALIGKWKSTDASATSYEFTTDGRLRMKAQGATQELDFRFLNDTQIELLAPSSTGQNTLIPFAIAGDKLTLTVPGSTAGQTQEIVLQREK
jgi:outer membrane biogenesis lipoprotein LolB